MDLKVHSSDAHAATVGDTGSEPRPSSSAATDRAVAAPETYARDEFRRPDGGAPEGDDGPKRPSLKNAFLSLSALGNALPSAVRGIEQISRSIVERTRGLLSRLREHSTEMTRKISARLLREPPSESSTNGTNANQAPAIDPLGDPSQAAGISPTVADPAMVHPDDQFTRP